LPVILGIFKLKLITPLAVKNYGETRVIGRVAARCRLAVGTYGVCKEEIIFAIKLLVPLIADMSRKLSAEVKKMVVRP